MCAILDANVLHEVFGDDPPPAGQGFLKWINVGGGRLVAGGKHREELKRGSRDFSVWARTAVRVGKIKFIDDDSVESRAAEIEEAGLCKSNDPHVIAVAQISGARLLYSNDPALQQDFGDSRLIDDPRGKVYSTRINREFTRTHRRLLGSRDLCRME